MKKRELVHNLRYLIGFLHKNVPTFLYLTLVINIIIGVVKTYLNIYLLMQILELIESNSNFSDLVNIVFQVVIIEILLQLIESIYKHRIYPEGCMKLKKIVHSSIIDKASTIDIECYDNPQYYDNIIISLEKSDEILINTIDLIALYSRDIFGLLAIVPLIGYINLVLMTIVVFSVVLSIIIQKKLNSYYYKRYLEMIPHIKRNSYIMTRFAFWEYAEELRLNNFPSILIQQFKKTYSDMNEIIKKHGKKIVFYSIGKGLASYVIIDIIIFSYLTYKLLITKTLTVVMYTTVLAAVYNVKGYLSDLAENYEKLVENSLYVTKIHDFINYENHIIGGNEVTENVPYDIEFKHVFFKYPFSNNYILKDFSLHISPGEKVAIVGLNGAGKTTFVNLLLRLYDGQEGIISINGKDIKSYDLVDYRRSIGVVFQDYNLYSLSIGENISMEKAIERKRIEDVLERMHFDLEKVNVEVKVSSEFDDEGIQLSGGESQKIAVARALIGNKDTIILDEPSSSLDPFMEAEINNIVCKEMENKTVIFISHRLTTTTLVDRIFLIEDGLVVESGSHIELMRKHGKYERMFTIQAEKYMKKDQYSIYNER